MHRLPSCLPALQRAPTCPCTRSPAQVRHIIYHKGLEGEFDIVSPMALGGLGSPQYNALNPQGKMPLLLLPDGMALPESEVGAARHARVCVGGGGGGAGSQPADHAHAAAAAAARVCATQRSAPLRCVRAGAHLLSA